VAVPRLFGAETEYAISHLAESENPGDRSLVVRTLMECAAKAVPNVLAYDGRGIFFANGGRLYIDLTDHPEYATAECTSPVELLAKLQESDNILAMLSEQLAARHGGDVFVTKTNVDYMSHVAWGCHESYHIARGREADRHLIPFLVTRQIYAGSGGFNNLTDRLEFVLSPRVPHFQRVSSSESTHSRGIIHTRDESHGRQEDRRLHVIVGEALFSETSILLKAGVTAIVVGLIEAGVEPGNGVGLKNPLAALRRFSLDPECKADASTESGQRLRAIDIQRHYLEHAERSYPALPVWAPQVCRLWREVLDGLECGAEQERLRLDWVIRRHLFTRRLALRNWTWDDAGQRERHPDDYDAVRCEMYELDTKFGRPGPGGLFHAFEEAGVLDHQIDRGSYPEEEVRSRAHLRGRIIQESFDAGLRRDVHADWSFLVDGKRQATLDLRNPFQAEENWQTSGTGLNEHPIPFFRRARIRVPAEAPPNPGDAPAQLELITHNFDNVDELLRERAQASPASERSSSGRAPDGAEAG
jgi:proteasome accessory factor A